MERSSNHNDLATALAEARPSSREDFARELDERVAAGFPRRSRLAGAPLSSLSDRLRGLSIQRLFFATGVGALAAIAIATVLVASQGPSSQTPILKGHAPRPDWHGVQFEAPPAKVSAGGTAIHAPAGVAGAASSESEGSEVQYGPALGSTPRHAPGESSAAATSGRAHRAIERSAELSLRAAPADVAADSAAVFAAVHDAHGIVLRSTTTSGKRAGAHFELLLPSAGLGDALGAFSAIDEVQSRHEATDDITAPTVTARERLRDSRARIDGLLGRLSTAETEAETTAIEVELARERDHAAHLRTQLDELEQRTDLSRVTVRIESDPSAESDGAWGIDAAFGDAGHILGIAAGVTLVGLAVLAPVALLCLLTWLAQRTWVRTQRRRALRNS